ncbi:MAG: GtrA family protein [Pseudoxanthomonas sp.]
MAVRLGNTIITQAARFVLVGIMNVAINVAVYAGLVHAGVHYILASAAGATLGILNSFAWSKFYVFADKGKAFPQLLRTILVYAVQIVVSWIGLVIMIELLKMNPYAAYAANIFIVTLASFLGLKYFAFRNECDIRKQTPP